MRLAIAAVAVVSLSVTAPVGSGQEPVGARVIAPGFSVRPDGVLDIGPLYAEVNHYDASWALAQQHDRFRRDPTPPPPAARRGAARTEVIGGVLTTARGPARLVERVERAAGGIHYSAVFTSAKPVPTNELAMAFLLPLSAFGGKTIRVDGQALVLPAAPRPKGQAHILTRNDVREVVLPMPTGALIVTGHFNFLVQDDREWGDARYSMRLHFSPASGPISTSRIDLRMVLDRARR